MKRGTWADVLMAAGIVFILLAAVTFGLLLLTPFGVSVPASWISTLLPLAGALGIILVAVAIYYERK
jgi:hypothetical protein